MFDCMLQEPICQIAVTLHIFLVLQFFEDVDVEIYLEYPLFSCGPSHVQRTAKLEVRILKVKLIQLQAVRFSNQSLIVVTRKYSTFLGF